MKIKSIISGLQDVSSLSSFQEAVLTGGVRPSLAKVSLIISRPDELVIMVADLGLRLAAIDVAGLNTEHERHADKHNDHEEVHQGRLLSLIAEQGRLVRISGLATIHSHVEHRIDNGRSLAGVITVVTEPLCDDHEVHEAEEAHEHDELREKLEGEVDAAVVVSVIAALKDDSEGHLENTKDEGNLHLDRVDEQDFILGHVPDWIYANWVDTVGLESGQLLAYSWQIPARIPKIHAHRGEVVVDETAED